MDFAASHPALADYLAYTKNTESPPLFHAWAFLSGISAALGRRCWYEYGSYRTWPNMFVVLSGPPAVQTAVALSPIRRFLKENTNVRFAPDDTGGQRQGLIEAMIDDESEEDTKVIKALASSDPAQGLAQFTEKEIMDSLGDLVVDTRDPNTMYIHATQFNSVLGEKNTALLTFLYKLYDGDGYEYRLKSSRRVLENAVVGMLAGTTPAQIALAIPPEIADQSFLSRCIFVYADPQHLTKIPRPTLDRHLETKLAVLFAHVFTELNGAFHETKEAAGVLDRIYLRGAKIEDQRFTHYVQRRQDHLRKVCMVLAASRGDTTVELQDVQTGDKLLSFTEETMPDALGEFGLFKLGAAKQKLVEYVCSLTEPVPLAAIYQLMAKDMSNMDFKSAIFELAKTERVGVVDVPSLGKCVIGISRHEEKRRKNAAGNLLQDVAASAANVESFDKARATAKKVN